MHVCSINMKLTDIIAKVKNFPIAPGVYFFYGFKKEIIYIGKATNLRSRVQSYFRDSDGRGERIAVMVAQATDVQFQRTDSVLEALILESNLIKKHQPKYNILEKDDKSFSYFAITQEKFPKILILRKTEIDKILNVKQSAIDGIRIQKFGIYGPYVSKNQMEIALKIIRKIFPFHSNRQKTEKGCLDFQLGRCPGPYVGAISQEDYAKNIAGIKMILAGKKQRLLIGLKREMLDAAQENEFEKAAEIRNKIFALEHIRDVALISKNMEEWSIADSPVSDLRIEAYDISNIGGQQAVGSMVVFAGENPNKNEYRKFKIKNVTGSDDVAMLKEVLTRRIRNNNWLRPDIVLLDGGSGHLNMAKKLFESLNFIVPLVAIAKGVDRKGVDVRKANFHSLIDEKIYNLLENKNLIKRIMDEAHRFAISFHRKKRDKAFFD